jgi:hypothetical protein
MKLKSRLAFDSDEYTETGEYDEQMQNIQTGEEVASEVEGPQPGDPKGNPHEYLDEKKTKDGVPFDDPNSEHLSAEEDPVYQTSKLHEDAKKQEPGKDSGFLASIVEHEGHSAGVHLTESGFEVRGKGSASYLRSEPIAKREHAEEYAKEMLKAHAKLNEREIVSRNTNLSETADLGWGNIPPKEKKKLWEGLTGSSKHKITACMNKIDGHVDNPGAYCKSLADEVGYKPE